MYLLNKSTTLNNYNYFVNLIKQFILENENTIEKDKLLKFSIKQAIKVCLNRNILSNFLNDNASELINIITTEFNLDDAKSI